MTPLRRILAYHELNPASSQDVYHITPAVFRAHLAALFSHPSRASHLQITFDDAHQSQIDFAAPVLAEFGQPALFFAPAAWIDRRPGTATWSALRSLIASGHSIGSHGLTHTLLTHCSPAQLQRELRTSRCLLEDKLGVPVHAISMPGGRWNRQVASAVCEAGYRQLYTSNPALSAASSIPCIPSLLSATQPRLSILPRLIVRRTMRANTILRYTQGTLPTLWHFQAEYLAKQSLQRLCGDALYQHLWRRLLRHGNAHAPSPL